MGGYYFRPMMAVYGAWLQASDSWVRSRTGRLALAGTLRSCKEQHGRTRAREFLHALIWVGVYPILLRADR